MTKNKLIETKGILKSLQIGRADTEQMSEETCLKVFGISKATVLANMDAGIAQCEREIERAEHPLKSAAASKPATATARISSRFRSGAWKPPSRKPTKPGARASNQNGTAQPFRREGMPNPKEDTNMDTYEQLRALAAMIAELSVTGVWKERDVMEALLSVFTPQELAEFGYGDRVNAYLEEYGG